MTMIFNVLIEFLPVIAGLGAAALGLYAPYAFIMFCAKHTMHKSWL